MYGDSPLKKAVSFHGVPHQLLSDQDGDTSLLAAPGAESDADAIRKTTEQVTQGHDSSRVSDLKGEGDRKLQTSASGQRDPSIILTYLKKNKYDDTGITDFFLLQTFYH